MEKQKNTLGEKGELIASRFLKKQGYEILDRNFKNNSGRRLGEIDIIARDKNTQEIVFVEVKTRELLRYGNTLPEENITYQKLRKLSKIAEFYLRIKRLEDQPYRFDAISIWTNKEGKEAKIKHIPGL